MQAASLQQLHVTSAHSENTLDVWALHSRKGSLGNTTNIQMFFNVNIVKINLLLTPNWGDFEGLMRSENGQLNFGLE